jgi:hypothetical protein
VLRAIRERGIALGDRALREGERFVVERQQHVGAFERGGDFNNRVVDVLLGSRDLDELDPAGLAQRRFGAAAGERRHLMPGVAQAPGGFRCGERLGEPDDDTEAHRR